MHYIIIASVCELAYRLEYICILRFDAPPLFYPHPYVLIPSRSDTDGNGKYMCFYQTAHICAIILHVTQAHRLKRTIYVPLCTVRSVCISTISTTAAINTASTTHDHASDPGFEPC